MFFLESNVFNRGVKLESPIHSVLLSLCPLHLDNQGFNQGKEYRESVSFVKRSGLLAETSFLT